MAGSSTSCSRHPSLRDGGVGECDIESLRYIYDIPSDISIVNCSMRDHQETRFLTSNVAPFFASFFEAGLTLPMHPFVHEVLRLVRISPNQGTGNFYRLISSFLLLGKLIGEDFEAQDLLHAFALRYKKDSGFYFQRRKGVDELFPGLPGKDNKWDLFPLLVSGNWEFGPDNTTIFKKPINRHNSADGLDLCKEINHQQVYQGPPSGYERRAKKAAAFSLQDRDFFKLLEIYAPYSEISEAHRSVAGAMVIPPALQTNADLSSLNPPKPKRRLVHSDGRKVPSGGEESPGRVKGDTGLSQIRSSVPDEEASPELPLARRSKKAKIATVGGSSSNVAPSSNPIAGPTPLEVVVSTLGSSQKGADFLRLPPPPPRPPPVASKAVASFKTKPVSQTASSNSPATAEEKKKAGAWVPSFVDASGDPISNEGSLYHNEGEAFDVIKGLGTPRDKRFLASKSGPLRHKTATWYMLKALMLNASNDALNSSLILEKQELADSLRRVTGAMELKEKELKAALAREEQLKRDAESVSGLRLELKDSQGKLRCSMEQVKKVQARADRHAGEVQELTSAADILNSKIARLTEENAELTRGLESAAQASQDLVKSEMEEARVYYQGVVDEVIKKYYLEGKLQGRKECLEEYDIVEIDDVCDSEDTQALSSVFPSLTQGSLAVVPENPSQESEVAHIQAVLPSDPLS